MSRPRLLVATRSAHKLRELRELLAPRRTASWSRSTTSGSPGDPVEDGETFETNAAIKARFGARAERPADARRRLRHRGRRARRRTRASGRGGTPARTPPTTTNNAQAPRARSTACRRSAAAPATSACSPWRCPSGAGPRGGAAADVATRGTCRGRIATEPRGTGGFGYDPIFEPASEPPGGRTLGLWTPAEKHAISHRARAARRMAPRLRRPRVLRRWPRRDASACSVARAPGRDPRLRGARPRGRDAGWPSAASASSTAAAGSG